MKILVLLSRIPWPLEKGDKLRAFHQIKELSDKHEIFLFCLNDSPVHPEAEKKLKSFCSEVHFFSLSKAGIFWRLFSGLFSGKPFQVKYFHSQLIQRKLEKEINRINPDHIYAQLIRVSEYVKNIHHIPKTLDYMDALSKGMERRISKSGGIFKYFLKIESKRLLEYESLIFDYFENKTIISEQDRSLIYHPDQHKIIVVPNGVDTVFFKPIKKEIKFQLLFNGNMSYPPNVDCAIYIAEQILPVLEKRNIPYRLMISGSNPVRKILELSKKNKNITVSGWMDDIRNAYSESRIFLAPMQIGTGLQNKLLEAMSMGLPCITTELANNALGARPDEEILIGNSPDEMANHIENLIRNSEHYQFISAKGQAFVTKKYNWKSTVEILNRIFSASVNKS